MTQPFESRSVTKSDGNKVALHQVKSRWYYVFWGIATIAVFSGQLYVGSGYRKMATQQGNLTRAIHKLIVQGENDKHNR